MAYVVSYSHFTDATIPAAVWDQAWFTLESWKGYLQSLPGYLGLRMSARPLDDGNIRFRVVTVWSNPEQLEAWVDSKWSSEALLRSFEQPAYDIVEDAYEDFA